VKAILEFDLDEPFELSKFKRAMSATEAYLIISGMQDYFRHQCKYIDLSESDYKVIEEVSNKLYGLIAEYNINMNDLD
jgi:hypothetical protein